MTTSSVAIPSGNNSNSTNSSRMANHKTGSKILLAPFLQITVVQLQRQVTMPTINSAVLSAGGGGNV